MNETRCVTFTIFTRNSYICHWLCRLGCYLQYDRSPCPPWPLYLRPIVSVYIKGTTLPNCLEKWSIECEPRLWMPRSTSKPLISGPTNFGGVTILQHQKSWLLRYLSWLAGKALTDRLSWTQLFFVFDMFVLTVNYWSEHSTDNRKPTENLKCPFSSLEYFVLYQWELVHDLSLKPFPSVLWL